MNAQLSKHRKLTIPTAEVFVPLLEPARYKGIWGGRGSGKSQFFADNLIDRSFTRGHRQVCIREVQKSLKESAKRLIEDKLDHYGLGVGQGFKVFREVIETPGDGIIMFQGMQDSTAESIKSLEGFDTAFVEEAQSLSQRSLELLRPTIRKEGSELWFAWNPRFKNDPVDVLLRQGDMPTGATVVKANWSDNPWFPDVLEQERLDCFNYEPENYEHIWEGGYVTITKGAYFARHLAEAREQNRIGHVAADPLIKIRLFCDIGGTGSKSDAFAIWAVQFVGQEIRLIDYYEAQGQDMATHVAWMNREGYTPERASSWLPHDGKTNDRVYDVSYESAFKAAGYDVTVIPNQGKGAAMARIEEARRLFPQMYFDQKACDGGLEALGWYHEKIDEKRGIGLGPDHDWASHGADAFGLMAVAHETQKARAKPIQFKKWG